jgi:hypothetical protein
MLGLSIIKCKNTHFIWFSNLTPMDFPYRYDDKSTKKYLSEENVLVFDYFDKKLEDNLHI